MLDAPTSTSSTASSRMPLKSRFTQYRDNADEIVPLTVDAQAPDRDDQIRRVALAVCPFLNHDATSTSMMEEEESESVVPLFKDDRHPLQVKPLEGGLSNELFIVSQSHTPSVLVRIHPDETDEGFSVVDREVENRLVAWLSQQQGSGDGTRVAPIYYGRFENGRVEEFYPNVMTLSHTEMPEYATQIAQHMADFHRLAAPHHILPKPKSTSVYETLDKWFSAAGVTIDNDPSPNAAFVQTLHTEWTWLRNELETTPTPATPASPIQTQALEFIRQVVLAHMDCQSLNVLKNMESSDSVTDDDDDSSNHHHNKNIKLIDFEYAGWNPRAADIANTFWEYCDMNNLRAKYDTEYPTAEQQSVFFRSYVQRADPSLADAVSAEPNQWDDFLDTLRREVGRFSLLSHLVWSVWSVLKATEESGIDFDYMAYARHRMDGYEWAKTTQFHQS
jgi:thiamine kinase-like enzyme